MALNTFHINILQKCLSDAMKSINAKRIAAVVGGAALLGIGLAFASPVSYQSVPIINNAGQPVVQIVIGHAAQPSDGAAAGNLAAAIGNLAFTQSQAVAPVNVTKADSVLGVSVTSGSATVSNQKVWLNESSTAYISGTFSFGTLIGSVINKGILAGTPLYTKPSEVSGVASTTGYENSNVITPSPSPYTVAGAPYTSVSATLNGGGVSFTTGFRYSNYDQILEITNQELPALLNNYGGNGENEELWVTGFPVYDQQSGTTNFALQAAGAAYEVTFNKPIPEYTSNKGVNTATIQLLGQTWSIIGYNSVDVQNEISTQTAAGGSIDLAASLTNLTTVYVGENLTSGPFKVSLSGVGNAGTNGIPQAAINIYYDNSTTPTNSSIITPASAGGPATNPFNVSGHIIYLKVNSTFNGGSFPSQQFAKMQLYTNVYNLQSGQDFNKTNDPGWTVDLLWTNATSTSGKSNELEGIVIFNSSTTTLLPGQSLNIIGDPAAWKLSFVGQTLSSAQYDPLSFSVTAPSSVEYSNSQSTGTFDTPLNITEPAQYLTMTSSISDAFSGSFGGSPTDQVVWNMAPYYLAETTNGITGSTPINIVISGPTNTMATVNSVLTVTILGARTDGGSVTTVASGTFNGVSLTNQTGVDGIWNVTGIKISRAIPDLTVNVVQPDGGSNILVVASLVPTAPEVIYSQTGYQALQLSSPSASTSVEYSQQNGQNPESVTLSYTNPGSISGPTSFGSVKLAEWADPTYTLSDDVAIGLFNASAQSSDFFELNKSAGGINNNMTYTSTTSTSLSVPTGFVTERGSKIGPISSSTATIDAATALDTLTFSVGPANSTTTSTHYKLFGPYSVGQATNIPNVSIGAVNATVSLKTGSGYSITGVSNLTSEPYNQTVPVLLKSLPTNPLVVVDSNANQADSLILVGSGYVNTLSAQLQSALNVTNNDLNVAGGEILPSGNKILVAGWTANQTTAAVNTFIEDLYNNAATT